ncbi:MAG: GNAT family N-acetyltransferase [Alphaproteobacteria bacterium]|jgi:RimJ/RimL family protein N-acetyltransferase|nr:GNAT family N-acetyltransferase [Alphaproteobacteria bacterium]
MLSWRITYMERTAAPQNDAPPPPGVTFTRQADVSLDAYRDLHRLVGEEWLWWERLVLDDTALSAAISDPGTEIYILSLDAELAGFAELDRSDAAQPAIRYFGLAPDFIGRRLGGHMMECLLRRAWRPEVHRVTLDTCDLDHPAAIPFYRRHGFKETHTELCEAEDPREAGILPMTAGGHIELNRKLRAK